MNIRINPGASLDAAKEIDDIVERIKSDLQELDMTIKRVIPDGIKTEWADQVRVNWESYYTADIPEAMEAMKNSASNLRLAVNEALSYSKESR